MLTHLYSGTNRLADRLPDIRARVDGLDESARVELDQEMALSGGEYYAYQTAQSRAAAVGRLTTDEALFVYTALGRFYPGDRNGGWADGTDTATKVLVTLVMGEILPYGSGR